MSKSFSMMRSFKINDLFAIERAFKSANLMGLGPGLGAEMGCCLIDMIFKRFAPLLCGNVGKRALQEICTGMDDNEIGLV